MSTPWLSVIVPTYNGAAYLPAALESIVAQGDPDIEVIAVDDGSTDATPAILESFANRLRLTLIRRRIGNWVANTNLGLEHARGEWTCFLHQDDLWRPGRLRAIRRALTPRSQTPFGNAGFGHSVSGCLPGRNGVSQTVRSQTEFGNEELRSVLVLTAAEFITSSGRSVGPWRCPLASVNSPAHVAERLLVQNFVPLPAAVFRREGALKVGGLDPDLWYTADWDFWLKLTALGPTHHVARPLAAFRLHPESQTVKRSVGMAEFRRQHEIVFERHWPLWRDMLPDPRRIAAAARLSVETNVLLARMLHRAGGDWTRLGAASASAGLAAATYFVRSARLLERVTARLRAGLLSRFRQA